MAILNIFKDNFLKFDWIIVVLAIYNAISYWQVKKNADKLYNHYNSSDKLSNLPEEALDKSSPEDEMAASVGAADKGGGRNE